MAYTEIKIRNGRKYYYRVISVREGRKIGKKRLYLGVNLSNRVLAQRQLEADKKILLDKSVKNIDKIKFQILPILKRYKIKKAGIFGSYARGEQNKKSDVDILVEPAKNMGFAFAGLEIQLAKALRRKVDLVSYNGLNIHLKERILKEEVRII